MTFQRLAAAALAAFSLALPAFAHDGVHINNAYARSNGMTGAVFFEIENHQETADRLIGVTTDAAKVAQLHTHIATADGVMQMREVPDGFPVPALGTHLLQRGGDHVMLMGLTRQLNTGDMVHLVLTFEHAGVVEVDVTVDNERMAEGMGETHGEGHAMTEADGED